MDLPCIGNNFERTFQHKTFQLNDLSDCSFQLHTSPIFDSKIMKKFCGHKMVPEMTQKFWAKMAQIGCKRDSSSGMNPKMAHFPLGIEPFWGL